MSLLVVPIAAAGNNDNYNGPHQGTCSSPDKEGWVHSVVVVAFRILPLPVAVPFGAVSVVIAAVPGAVIVSATFVIAHL